VWIAGYGKNRPAQTIHDDLWVRALALSDGQQGVVLAVTDLLGFNAPFVERVRDALATSQALLDAGILADSVLVAATHTHSGPDTIGLWGPDEMTSGVDPQYNEFLVQTVIACIEEAVRNLQPAALRFATGSAPGLSRNDRFRNILEQTHPQDDYATRDIPAEVEILDPEFAVLQATTPDGSRAIATLVNWACHPEMAHTNTITSDFPNFLRQRLEERLGGTALYFNGAQGGMITGNITRGEDIAGAERIGLALADKVLQALEQATPAQAVAIALQRTAVTVPLENEGFKAAMQAGVIPANLLPGDLLRTEVAHLTLGPAEFVTIPGEALPNLGFYLKRLMKGQPKFVLGLCNDELGYILTREDWGLPLYSYETSMSVGSRIGQVVCDALAELIAANPPQVAPAAAGALAEEVADFFANLPKGFKPEKAGDLNAVYAIHLTGEGGGDWTISVANQKCEVVAGLPASPSMTISALAADWMKIVKGELDPAAAVLGGKLKLEPLDPGLATKFAELFF